MAPDRSDEIERLYHTARSRAPEEQAAFLETASAGDGALRQEVESLLAQDEAVESFLEVSAAEVAVRMIREDMEENLVGRQLVSYQVRSHIGTGEMGEVYLARDLTLNRDVAIKVLLRGFEQTPDRLARFRREAETLALLNHHNIATIHGFEQSGDLYFLVLEFVPGQTLADQLAKGLLPLQETLRICGQVAEALEEAHRNGITHRDIKPANIKVTLEGKVKVLDFGLAKVFSEGSPTFLTAAHNAANSQPGLILGTPAYMSPEQARGKPVDKQTDIWAFGCLLYEMLTTSPAFRGETLTDTMAAVLEHEPDWSRLPSGIPEEIQLLLRRCLEKEKNRRLHDIADARLTIEDALSASEVTASSRRITFRYGHNRRLRSGATVIAVIAAVALIVTLVREFFPKFITAPSPVNRFTYVLPPGERLTMLQASARSLSPDGRQFAYVASVEGAGLRFTFARLTVWTRSP